MRAFLHRLGRDFGILDIDALARMPISLYRQWLAFYEWEDEQVERSRQEASVTARLH